MLVGLCDPPIPGVPIPCALDGSTVCLFGQQCAASPTGYCVDRTSAQYDGTAATLRFTLARDTEIAVKRPSQPNVYDSRFTFRSKKFHNSSAQTVNEFSGTAQGSDYSPGTGTLLVWGRPGFSTQQPGRAQLYLLTHSLPLAFDDAGALVFRPRYYSGVDPQTNEPEWSEKQADAVPLALDGRVDGDPTEPIDLVNQMTFSWLGPPISRWVMLYGGTTSDALGSTGKGVLVRFAEHPGARGRLQAFTLLLAVRRITEIYTVPVASSITRSASIRNRCAAPVLTRFAHPTRFWGVWSQPFSWMLGACMVPTSSTSILGAMATTAWTCTGTFRPGIPTQSC